MGQIWLLSKITYKEGVRSRILLGILIVALIFSIFNIIFTQLFPHDLSKVSVDLGLSTVSLAGLAVIFFMGINLIARDFEKRTIYMVLSRPIARWQYILGKYLGLSLMVGTAVGILGLFSAAGVKTCMWMAPAYVPVNYSWGIFAVALVFSYLGLMILTALALFFTSLTTSSYIALLVTACAYFIGQNVELVRNALSGSNEAIGAYGMLLEMVTWLFPDLQAFDLKTAAAYGVQIDILPQVWTALYGLGYIGIILVLTVIIFNRRELS